MTDVEALFWRAEADPSLRSGGVIVEVLDSTPDWDRLVAAHGWAVRAAPRLGHRVVDDPLRIGPPAWVPAVVDLDHHLSRVTLGGSEGMDRVLAVAADLHMADFDRSRPLWRAVLVEGLPGATAAYLLKVHHSMTDGQGMVQLLDLLHGRSARPDPDKPVAVRDLPGGPDTPLVLGLQRAVEALAAAPTRIPAAAGRAGRVLLGLGGSEALAAARRYGASLARVAGPAPARPSPLLRARSLERRLLALDAPLGALKGAGRAAGGSLNDAYIAALLGGFRRYHLDHGMDPADLPMALPVSLRRPGDEPGGNRFAAASIAGPAAEPDAARRIRLVRERVARVRSEPALDFMAAAAPVASRLPAPILTLTAGRAAGALDLQASNIVGLTRPAFIAGGRVEAMYVFGPVPGSAVMATLISHLDTCHIGVVVDCAAVPDADRFRAALAGGLDEVLALSGGGGR